MITNLLTAAILTTNTTFHLDRAKTPGLWEVTRVTQNTAGHRQLVLSTRRRIDPSEASVWYRFDPDGRCHLVSLKTSQGSHPAAQ